MPKRSSQGFFDFTVQLARYKTADQVATERILAQEMRENPPPDRPGEAFVREDMRSRIKKQRAINALAETGKVPETKQRR